MMLFFVPLSDHQSGGTGLRRAGITGALIEAVSRENLVPRNWARECDRELWAREIRSDPSNPRGKQAGPNVAGTRQA